MLSDYLGWVRREYGYSRLHGLQTLQNTGPLGKPLSTVYTSLAVRHRPAVTPGGESDFIGRIGRPDLDQKAMTSEPQPVDMAELLTLGEKVAIIGGAGSGKTTYLRLIASALARALWSGNTELVKDRLGLDGTLPLPILVPLSEYHRYRKGLGP